MERIKQFWNTFKDIPIVFSFVVNLVLVFVLLILATFKFDLPVKFTLPLNQNTTVTTLTPTHISTIVNLSLGAFGKVNAPVSLELPAGTPIQVNLTMDIPVSFDQRLAFKFGKSGLNPVVAELRNAAKPYVAMQKSLP